MKQPHEWTESDIQELIKNEIPESLHLDYKRIDSLQNKDKRKNEIAKDVSAFANSDGGVLIYGIIEENNKPLSHDNGVDPSKISREWLEQVINSRINRRIPEVRINQINLTEPKGNVIYVVEIPQSHLAPHMAFDNKYYKRFNFQSVAMEEYEVRDISNRFKVPDLTFHISLISSTTNQNNTFDCNFTLKNHSPVPAEYTSLEFLIDSQLRFAVLGKFSEGGTFTSEEQGKKVTYNRYYKNLIIPNYMPILKGINFDIASGPVSFYYPKEPGDFIINVRVTTAQAETKNFYFLVTFDGKNILISDSIQR